MKKKKILFATASAGAIGPQMPDRDADIIDHPGTGSQANNANLADELLRRANAWLTAEKINYAQYDVFRRRLKETPAVVDAKLAPYDSTRLVYATGKETPAVVDANVIVCTLTDGTEHRILPGAANLPEFTVIDRRDTWTILGLTWKKKYWIATFSATAVLIAVLSILAAKHR